MCFPQSGHSGMIEAGLPLGWGGGGGGHSGAEGGRTCVTYFAEEGVFFKTSACPRFCKPRGALPVFYFPVILDYSFTEQILRLSECTFANNEIYPLSASVTKTLSQILYFSIAHVQISRVNKKINTFSSEGCKYAAINQLFNSKNNLVDIFFNF